MAPPDAGESGITPERPQNPRGLRAVEPAPRSPEPPRHNLPLELSSFVGREKELAEVKRLLGDARLLTLTGPGGCGKTRLALVLALEVVKDFEDGVWWTGLASLSDPDLVPQELASTLGVREAPGRTLTELLTEHLQTKRLLLILDNCEHLVGACASVVDTLLRACPNLKILATSREALGVAGEMAWIVPSLGIPDPERPLPIAELVRYEAIGLFVERARFVAPRFELSAENATSGAELCRRLDGMPLAIELAAARAGVLSVEQIASRLEDSFKLLASRSRTTDPRQQTLRATIDWSYDLLSEDERILFRRVSVFAGGFTLAAAEVVCADVGLEHDDVLEVLSRLVEKSLVVMRERNGEARYHLLEMIRHYGREKLEESGETQALRRSHADYFLAVAEEAEPNLTGAEQGAWLGLLETELDNLRAAIGWSVRAGEPEMGLRLAGALLWFCYLSGRYSEGREWFEEVLAKSGASPAPLRAKALYGMGDLLFLQCEYDKGRALLQESAALYRELGDKRGLASVLRESGCVEREQGRYAQARALHEEAMALWRELGDEAGIADTLVYLGMVAWLEGDHERAEALGGEALTTSRRLGQTHGVIWSLIVLGAEARNRGDYERGTKLLQESLALSRDRYAEGVAVSLNQLGIGAHHRGEHERATVLLKESLLLHRDVGDRWRVASVLEGLAEAASAMGDHERAARMFGVAEALRKEIGAPLPPCERADYEQAIAAARAGLTEEDLAAAWSEGRAMTYEQAVEYALDQPPPPTPSLEEEDTSSAPRVPHAGLSARETEVLKLVAKGLTNAQVANELFISPRTVNRHLNSIYHKLEVRSRAAATRFAADNSLL